MQDGRTWSSDANEGGLELGSNFMSGWMSYETALGGCWGGCLQVHRPDVRRRLEVVPRPRRTPSDMQLSPRRKHAAEVGQ